MALFINGILIFTIELKNQTSGQNINSSKAQYQSRKNNINSIKFKRVLAHLCSDTNEVAFTTKLDGENTTWFPFNKDITNPPTDGYSTEYLWQEIFAKDSVLEIIERFVFIDKKGSLIFPRYHQIDVVRKLEKAVRKEKTGNRYLIQHATGSGKSNSIAWLAHLLSSFYLNKGDKKNYFDSVIILTNRKILDNQISNTVSNLSQQENVVFRTDDKSSKQLMNALETKKRIVISTIQKFLYIHNHISSLKGNFAVIIDEVHDTYSGKTYTTSLNETILGKNYEDIEPKEEGEEINQGDLIDAEDLLVNTMIEKAQPPNASYFGFTGTPKKRTIAMFSHNKQSIQESDTNDSARAFHIYSMEQSITEGFTLDVLTNYTTYNTFFSFLQKDQDKLVDRNIATKEIMKMFKGNINIRQTCEIIVNHFIENVSHKINNEARAMIVTASRPECVKYFRQINKILDEKKAGFNALVAFSPFTTKERELIGFPGNNTQYDPVEITEEKENQSVGFSGNIPRGLKTPKYRILVIANKYQTGFDEPLLHTMYVCRPLVKERAVQTLSRLNRIYPSKEETFVLDFVNTIDNIQKSFEPYYQTTVMNGDIDFDSIWNNYETILQKEYFTKEDISEFYEKLQKESHKSQELNSIIDRGLEKLILDDKAKRKNEEDMSAKENFKTQLSTFNYGYGFFSMLPAFANHQNVDLEKLYWYSKYFEMKIPIDDVGEMDLSKEVELKNLRIAMTGKNENISLVGDSLDAPSLPNPEMTTKVNPKVPLSEIIKTLNEKYEGGYDQDIIDSLVKVWEATTEDLEIKETITNDSNQPTDVIDKVKSKVKEIAASQDFELWKILEADPQYENKIKDLIEDYKAKNVA
tara:strand:- start:2637 stop:5228 length:2592 start_codon:yes stop_codon:yes gene_type:complete